MMLDCSAATRRQRARVSSLGHIDLSHADLTNADLSDATLIDTDFTGATLAGTEFRGARLRNVRGLGDAAARGARDVPAPGGT